MSEMHVVTPAKPMESGSPTSALPRLLYAGDVPVESSYHGSALLYRLFQEYPPEKLCVVEADLVQSVPERRLPGVQYRRFLPSGKRLQYTRFSGWASSWLAVSGAGGTRRLRRSFDGFDPQAVVTVPQGFSWLAAARLAKEANLPLHLIVHDDWPSSTFLIPSLKQWKDREFGRIYRQAASRLCVSPFMEDAYRRDYGAAGQVLYPARAKDSPTFDELPGTCTKGPGPLVAAYAGNLFHAYPRMVLELAACLERSGGRLLLFGPHSPENLRSHGLNRANILSQGLVSSTELISRLRKEADFVLVPMSFAPGQFRRNAELSFPSKLTDYTAAGLPLLIWGPEYCSAVRWARQYEAVAEVITSEPSAGWYCSPGTAANFKGEVTEGIDRAVNRLEDAHHRKRLGMAAIEIGDRLFSHRASIDILYRALRQD